jgi:hypothetical protein
VFSPKVVSNNFPIKLERKKMYKLKIEGYSGQEKEISLPSKGAVANFINRYPDSLPIGISVKFRCDLLGVSGTLRGRR